MDRLPRPSLENRVSSYPRYEHVTPSLYPRYTNVKSPPVDITLFYLFLEMEVSASGSSYIIHDTNMP